MNRHSWLTNRGIPDRVLIFISFTRFLEKLRRQKPANESVVWKALIWSLIYALSALFTDTMKASYSCMLAVFSAMICSLNWSRVLRWISKTDIGTRILKTGKKTRNWSTDEYLLNGVNATVQLLPPLSVSRVFLLVVRHATQIRENKFEAISELDKQDALCSSFGA